MSQSAINQFNKVASIYDWLATLVIGNVIQDAQRYHLDEIASAKEILILGGGTGWILKDIQAINATASILYVEASSSMIERAKVLSVPNTIAFIHGTEMDVPHKATFDIVITNFYFDLFAEASLRERIQLIKPKLKEKGRWLATDFVPPKRMVHRFLLWTMYRFFRITTNIEATSLPRWNEQMNEQGMVATRSKGFKHDFIMSKVFQDVNK